MSRSFRSRCTRVQGDDGMGLVLVIGVIAFLTAVALTATAYAVNSLKQSSGRSNNELSLATAENGVDFVMAKLQRAYTTRNADVPIPNNVSTTVDPTPYCNAAKVTFPAVLANGTTVSDADGNFFATGTIPAEQNERTWAREKLEALVAVAGCKQPAGSGEFVALKPPSVLVSGVAPRAGKIYSLSAVPSFANRQRTRLVKSEYIFSPYRPTNAILTGGNLQFQGSLTVTTASGFAPSLAQVHANGSIDVVGNAASVTGAVSSTLASGGSISGHAISTTTKQNIPSVSAREFYFQAPATDPTAMANWVDLCDNGHAYRWSASGPCDTSLTPLDSSGSYNNWTYSAASGNKVWTANPGVVSGTYFAYQTNVKNGTGNSSIANLSVIAASQNPDNCSSKKFGNIDWDHYDIAVPAFKGLWFYADGDVAVTSNLRIGSGSTAPPVLSGMIIAGDQAKLYTQSNSAVGAVVAADKCVSTQPSDSLVSLDEVHSDLYYDPNLVGPFTSIITNTLWLDYSS